MGKFENERVMCGFCVHTRLFINKHRKSNNLPSPIQLKRHSSISFNNEEYSLKMSDPNIFI